MALVGYGCFDNPNSTIEEALHDIDRVKFMADSLDALMRAVRYEHKTTDNKVLKATITNAMIAL